MIEELRLITGRIQVQPGLESIEGVRPKIVHRVTSEDVKDFLDVDYLLKLYYEDQCVAEIEARYRITFDHGDAKIPVLAQETTWPYFRQHVENQLGAYGFGAVNVLPVQNPLNAHPQTEFQGRADLKTVPDTTEVERKVPTWEGVIPLRLQIAAGLNRVIGEIINKRRNWFFSSLRLYTALLVADGKKRKGISTEIFRKDKDEDTFGVYFENETGILLEHWKELENELDKKFFLRMARDALLLTADSVVKDGADFITAELTDDYLQDIDETFDFVSLHESEKNISPQNHTSVNHDLVQKMVQMARKIYEKKYLPGVKGEPQNMARMSLGGDYKGDSTVESVAYIYFDDTSGGGEYWLKFAYSSNDQKLFYTVNIEFRDDVLDWEISKEWLKYKDFPSVRQFYKRKSEWEVLPELDEACLDQQIPEEIKGWTQNILTVRELNRALNERLMPLLTDIPVSGFRFLGTMENVDLSNVGDLLGSVFEVPRDVFEMWAISSQPRTRLGIAANLNTPTDLLEKLAIDKSRHVRQAVAANSNCPPSVFANLASDAWQVQAALATQQNLPTEVCWQLAHSGHHGILRVLEQCQKGPEELLVYLASLDFERVEDHAT